MADGHTDNHDEDLSGPRQDWERQCYEMAERWKGRADDAGSLSRAVLSARSAMVATDEGQELFDGLMETLIEKDNYGVHGSDFVSCRVCHHANGPGKYWKESGQNWHAEECPVWKFEQRQEAQAKARRSMPSTEVEQPSKEILDAIARGRENGYAIAERHLADRLGEMVDRFLAWKVPQDFSPDCGISFKPVNHPNCWPIGTNLLNADQAKAMLLHVVGLPAPLNAVVQPRETALAIALQDVLDDWANVGQVLPETQDRAHAAIAMPSSIAPTWVKTDEQMPPDATYVLGFQERTGNIAVGMAMKRDDGLMWMFGATMGHESKFPHLKFTHWMPLPSAPSHGKQP